MFFFFSINTFKSVSKDIVPFLKEVKIEFKASLKVSFTFKLKAYLISFLFILLLKLQAL